MSLLPPLLPLLPFADFAFSRVFALLREKPLNMLIHLLTFPLMAVGLLGMCRAVAPTAPVVAVLLVIYGLGCLALDRFGLRSLGFVLVLLPHEYIVAQNLFPAYGVGFFWSFALFLCAGLAQFMIGHRIIEGQFPQSLPDTATAQDRALLIIFDLLFGQFVLWSTLSSLGWLRDKKPHRR
jgi:hypothetical protein